MHNAFYVDRSRRAGLRVMGMKRVKGEAAMNRRELLKLSGATALAALYPGSPLLADEIGVDLAAKTVTVGGFTPITGPVPFYAILTHAADSYFKSVNERGGIKGWKIKYATLDDGYDPA